MISRAGTCPGRARSGLPASRPSPTPDLLLHRGSLIRHLLVALLSPSPTPLQCAAGDGFYVLRGVKLPEMHGSTVDAGATLEECGRRCLSNCSCTAYAASDIRGGGTGCIQWFGELMDTRFVDGGQDLFVRLARSDLLVLEFHVHAKQPMI